MEIQYRKLVKSMDPCIYEAGVRPCKRNRAVSRAHFMPSGQKEMKAVFETLMFAFLGLRIPSFS